MDRGTIISGIGHLGLILWVVLGDWLFAPKDMPEIAVAEVSMISEAEFAALVSSAPVKPAPAPDQPEITPPDPVQPDLPAAEPAPEQAAPREKEKVTIPESVIPL